MSNLAAIFGAGFDTNTVEPQGDFEVIPPGKYPVSIDKSEVKQTKKQDGHYLEVAMTVLDGEFRNRKLWDRINIQNPSKQCTEIGRRKLSALGRATGVTYISNENQFLGKTCMAHVKVKDEQNEIRTYSATANPCFTAPIGPQALVQAPVQPVAPMQMQPPYQPPTQQEQTQALQTAVSPANQPVTAGTPPWKR